ncbi:hypothetical protein WI36_29305 [Burkholderia ubonensis]|uniref:pYEATS domain-containing protein n=1 Tax=Burkholderia ubonensis TaxID=101571 RepID=UPI000756DF62|nr:pYEATS domain-containing protein [Burkholderia ubonensis]KUZ63570.1 hypothetical protein WI36_29305 [Burkholderia ubonensis]KUZ78398.1 hypothetical protein WI37_11745 [Burkholderia ubonensis]KUZ95545.1 hypothetical protein WI40_17630 [Burkholderia ubonensis]KVA16616.1 hypothetical protein WI42_18335 [Burkholderia ubonensis]KVA33191.1 hypothetical protein WI43_27840 [Burkholderia ubonensis]
MKTSLHFVAPSDLSVGTVRIQGGGQTIADWVATPGNRTFQGYDLKPGIYSAEIGPAGVSPQSVVFEIVEGQPNHVVLPSFSALASSGSNTSFFDADSLQTIAEVPRSISLDILETPGLPAYRSDAFPESVRENILDSGGARLVDVSSERRRITIGLSEEQHGRESFDTFAGESRTALFSGRLEIELPTDPHRDPWAGHRVRLSAAIEQVRIERCLLPLYRGGTRIMVAAPPFAPADLELGIVPADPRLRALARALDAGTSAEVAAVRDDVVGKGDPAAQFADAADPWAAMLVGLLAIRFPEIFPPIERTWADRLAERAGWAFDAHVIRASQALSSAQDAAPDAQHEAVAAAIAFLADAQVAGSPYYRYTNQLFAEMAAGIADHLKTNQSGVDPATTAKFDRLYGRWHRELPLQRGAGWTFTWLARDLAALKERNVLVPNRHASGRLRRRDTLILFEGQVSAGQIAIIGGGPDVLREAPNGDVMHSTLDERPEDATEHGLSRMPALGRAPGPDEDPNRGRFGGRAAEGGFHLTAAFEPTEHRDWATVILTVEAERSVRIGLGDFAWFVLHPTFSPSALKVAFRGNRARLRIQAWGGFTVGVWLPKAGVELECDLAKIEGAPDIMKLR